MFEKIYEKKGRGNIWKILKKSRKGVKDQNIKKCCKNRQKKKKKKKKKANKINKVKEKETWEKFFKCFIKKFFFKNPNLLAKRVSNAPL